MTSHMSSTSQTRAGVTAYSSASTASRPSASRSKLTANTSRLRTGHRPGTSRPRTSTSTRIESQQIICTVTESRGISPTVGLAFVNLDTAEAVMSQISDSQTYVRTLHKISVYAPSTVLISVTTANPSTTLYSLLEENAELIDYSTALLDRHYFAESAGLDYIQHLAFAEDVEAIKLSASGSYFAICCFAAVFKYIEHKLGVTFARQTLRVKYEPSEGAMMIDVSTIHSLELIQNLRDSHSKFCLYGLLNDTLTPMGARLLRSTILQPSTDSTVIKKRLDAVDELTMKEDMFFKIRQALKSFLDAEKILSSLILVPKQPSVQHSLQAINTIIMLKQFVHSIAAVCEGIADARSPLLMQVVEFCSPDVVNPIIDMIDAVLNKDVLYAKGPLELRNQRAYAIKSGGDGLLDVARQTYKEASEDALHHIDELKAEHDLPLSLKFDQIRQYYIQLPNSEITRSSLPQVFINIIKKKARIECQTLDLLKLNQKITDAHFEILCMSDAAIDKLTDDVRANMVHLFKSCDSIAMLDMLTAFAHLATTQNYVRPNLEETLAIQAGRHPIRERFHRTQRFIPNDVYATQQTRFQIITGCNMSGKSTYIRSVALMSIMTQIGSFVPATWASFPILHQLFARVNTDDSIEANMSTFAAEMREAAFILRNVDARSMAIIDELGRGTSTVDGLAIAIAISEALVSSRALVWFATHFRDLARILAERNGVINLHMSVDMAENEGGQETMTMLYKVAQGSVKERHYGLKLAKILPFPQCVIEKAQDVAEQLEAISARRSTTTLAVINQRRRRLILDLREQLEQAHTGCMEGQTLTKWLVDLREEFIMRMAALDKEPKETTADESSMLEEESDNVGQSQDRLDPLVT